MSRRMATRGFTLVELLVSMTVLIVLALGIGMILKESQQVVSVTQSSMRSNSAASAITGVLRADLQRVSKNGFFHIERDDTNGDRLIFTAAGPATAMDGSAGSGQILSIGLTDNDGTGIPKILYRQAFVLSTTLGGAWVTSGDKASPTFSQIQAASQTTIETMLIPAVSGSAPSGLKVPAESISDVNQLWQVLAPGCTELKIRYATGDKDGSGNLLWFPTSDGDEPTWTKFDQTNWPTAIRIRYKLVDDLFDAAAEPKTYEIICPIGQ